MSEMYHIWRKPTTARTMIAGWNQWADAGSVSSGLPQYLIEHTRAARLGRICPAHFYLFQIPGAHHLLRPVVRLVDGGRAHLSKHRNEFFFASGDGDDFLIFSGEEPHRDEDLYASTFLDAVAALGVETVAVVAGVHGPVPHTRPRRVSCVYSLRSMKAALSQYAVRFSNYEGGATIGMVLASKAEERGIRLFRFCAYVPTYDFVAGSVLVRHFVMENDHRAWYELMRRLNHMFHLGVDLSDLAAQSAGLTAAWDAQVARLASDLPQLHIQDYLDRVEAEFVEETGDHISDVWDEALRDILSEDGLGQ